MSEYSNIEWTDATFNPWLGCTKVSPGCANCYAETLMDKRYGRVKWGKGQARSRTSESNWRLPLRLNRRLRCDCGAVKIAVEDRRTSACPVCGGGYRSQRVFCGSLCDWLDEEAPVSWVGDLLRLIQDTPNLDWLLLTKRPEHWRKRMRDVVIQADQNENPAAAIYADRWADGKPPRNVWFGVSVEDQERADERIPVLQNIPASIRFLSVEPMLEPIRFRDLTGIHWAIFGGESGPGARECNIEWVRDAVRQCRTAGVSIFVKQLGSNVTDTITVGHTFWFTTQHRKGGDPAEWPEDLRVREFPV